MNIRFFKHIFNRRNLNVRSRCSALHDDVRWPRGTTFDAAAGTILLYLNAIFYLSIPIKIFTFFHSPISCRRVAYILCTTGQILFSKLTFTRDKIKVNLFFSWRPANFRYVSVSLAKIVWEGRITIYR